MDLDGKITPNKSLMIKKKVFPNQCSKAKKQKTRKKKMLGEKAGDKMTEKQRIKARIGDMRRARAGQVPDAEPNEQDRSNMESVFKSAPTNRKAKEHFARTLSPEQYLLYLKSQENTIPKNIPHRRKQKTVNSEPSVVVDAVTQTERPAFTLPQARTMPKQTK